MSFLGHVRIRETHGIRRFLYPVSVEIPATILDPADCHDGGPAAVLITPDDRQIPLQVTPGAVNPDQDRRLDFAVSLSPFEELELKLFSARPEFAPLGKEGRGDFTIDASAALDDPLRTVEEERRFRCSQRRFSTEFDRSGTLHEVEYDSEQHLRAPATFSRNGRRALLEGVSAFAAGFPLSARVSAAGQYPDGCRAQTLLETTAYKSWVMLTHSLSQTQPDDELVFNLPTTISSSVITCDFGVGGGIYGSLNVETRPEITWHSRLSRSGPVSWSIASGERTDYIGEAQTTEECLRQRWFHLVGGRKALAVAVTQVPAGCREMKVTLNANGDVTVAFRMGEAAFEAAAFGLCCHFLNNIPAIAAATNPQSILLPPVVSWTASDSGA
ncbi:MAG TPA: hypothetical protein VEF34_07340 [Syntrophobacteraceae bacterium]|nr:hypothetical protein [Syntrophobacteraceae bacterium]